MHKEEIREAKRQQQRLNFLLSPTELYNHFMQNKTDSRPIESSMLAVGASTAEKDSGQNIDDAKPMEEEDPEEIAFKEEAIRVAKDVFFEKKSKKIAFDDECLKFCGADSLTFEGVAEGSGNMYFLKP